MYRLEQIFIWLMRMHCCRGFGIQSPTDYAFVRYVVNEHYPYYSYSDMQSLWPNVSERLRKLYCLYFRISNFLQPDVIIGNFEDRACSSYLHAGCNKAEIRSITEPYVRSADAVELFIISMADERYASFISTVLDAAGERSMLIVEGIHRNRHVKNLWKVLRNDNRVGVSFDLYHAGVVFFDKNRYKQNYKINF